MKFPAPRRWLPVLLAIALATPVVARAQIEEPRIPLRTAINEINTFRSAYQDAYNKQDVDALVAMYAPDAVVVAGDGSIAKGPDEIRASLKKEMGMLSQITIMSDSMAVYGHTAWDVGTLKGTTKDGEQVSHYLAVLRRGLTDWQLSSVAVVPVVKKM
jgi:ketosteroid isomerase-like protein